MIERSIRFAILDDIRSRFPDAISWESANVLDYYQIRVISEYDVPFASISIFKSSSISITCVHPSDNSDQKLELELNEPDCFERMHELCEKSSSLSARVHEYIDLCRHQQNPPHISKFVNDHFA